MPRNLNEIERSWIQFLVPTPSYSRRLDRRRRERNFLYLGVLFHAWLYSVHIKGNYVPPAKIIIKKPYKWIKVNKLWETFAEKISKTPLADRYRSSYRFATSIAAEGINISEMCLYSNSVRLVKVFKLKQIQGPKTFYPASKRCSCPILCRRRGDLNFSGHLRTCNAASPV